MAEWISIASARRILVGASLAFLLAISVMILYSVASGSFGACSAKDFVRTQKETIENLDKIIDLGLKLSTTLVGFGTAVVIGIRSELKLGLFARLCVVVATILFAQSALYAIWWRFGIAESYLSDCFIVASDRLQRRFEAHVYLFMLGVVAIGVMVSGFLISKAAEADT